MAALLYSGSHFPPLDAAFQYFPDLRKKPRHERLPVVVHRVRRYSFPVGLLFDLPSSRLSFAKKQDTNIPTGFVHPAPYCVHE